MRHSSNTFLNVTDGDALNLDPLFSKENDTSSNSTSYGSSVTYRDACNNSLTQFEAANYSVEDVLFFFKKNFEQLDGPHIVAILNKISLKVFFILYYASYIYTSIFFGFWFIIVIV